MADCEQQDGIIQVSIQFCIKSGNPWKRHTLLKHGYFLLFIMIVTILCVKPIHGFCFKDRNACDVCTSPACVHAASKMMSSMDLTVDPCQDFYQYACGQWNETYTIPLGTSGYNLLSRMVQEFKIAMKKIFDRPPEIFTSDAEKRAHHFYQSCMNANIKEQLNGQPLLELLDQIGGWPAEEMPTDWNFQKILETTHNVLHSGGFFKWTFEEANESPNPVILLLPSGYSIPFLKSGNEKSTIDIADLQRFTRGIKEVIELLDISTMNQEQIANDIAEVSSQIFEIANSTMPSYVMFQRHIPYDSTSINNFQQIFPTINWNTYFQSAFSQVNNSITPSNRVACLFTYFTQLDKFISKTLADSAGPRKLHNYMGWQVISTYLPYLSRKFRNVCRLVRTEGCNNEETWQFCIDDTNNAMSFAVGAMYVQHEFNIESKPLVESIITAVKEAFEKNLERLDWMDDETRQAAKDKAEAMTVKTGYPEFILHQTSLDEFYSGLKIDSNHYFRNKFRSNQFSAQHHWMEFNKPFVKTSWRDLKLTADNVFYAPKLNQINLPVGALKNPYFDISFPPSLNFGAMGFFMGHELTHGFDSNGRQFDLNGDNRQWWNDATIQRFNQQTECLIDQYSSYHINGQHLDGRKSLGENMADNGGLKAAFRALNDWIFTRNEDQWVLPGLNLSHNQLFFLSFAQAFCSSTTDDFLLNQITFDPHAPDRYRVIGTLSNMIEFSSEFECDFGSPMNPPIRCEVW